MSSFEDRTRIPNEPKLRGAPSVPLLSAFDRRPARRISFEGDLSDYVPAAKRLLQLIDERGFALDRMYAAHESTSYDRIGLEADDPSN